ncbi:MAG: hypothetical protein MUF52_05860, partial [Syntrophobacteraceae bacterium]|nr:hypothetical protein [Syntrophobacteraceae bacterium]
MPRDIPIGNGRLLLCFDDSNSIRDLYFPHVGQESHLSGSACRMGVHVDSTFSWIGDGWRRQLLYEEDTLVSRADLYHWGMGVLITCFGVVDFHENVHAREIIVENLRPERRQVRLFFSHDFSISGNSIGDTAAFDPETGGVVHYKGNRYFLVNGMTEGAETLSQYAVGVKGVGDREGTYRDAEDGHLSGNPIAQGSVDSVIGLHLDLEGHSTGSAFTWICAGETWEAVRHLDGLARQKHPRALIRRTSDFWRLWVRKEPLPDGRLSRRIQEQYRRSLLILATQLDWRGGILAGNDSDVIQYNR